MWARWPRRIVSDLVEKYSLAGETLTMLRITGKVCIDSMVPATRVGPGKSLLFWAKPKIPGCPQVWGRMRWPRVTSGSSEPGALDTRNTTVLDRVPLHVAATACFALGLGFEQQLAGTNW
jgi:hypothetical protein